MSLDTLAALATILGTGVSILALIESRAWLVLISFTLVCLSLALWWYARQQRMALNSASTVIEGRSIDSLNIANLRRRVNHTFVVQTVRHTVHIEGEDMAIEWKYTGFCRTNGVSSMDFSIDSDEGTPFEQLHCVAFDLANDPEMMHPIRPILVEPKAYRKRSLFHFWKHSMPTSPLEFC